MTPKNKIHIILCNTYYTDIFYALTHLIVTVLATGGAPFISLRLPDI